MPQNLLSCEREQLLLMPPSLRDWLPEDHLARFMLASVEKLDLDLFYASYRADGHREVWTLHPVVHGYCGMGVTA